MTGPIIAACVVALLTAALGAVATSVSPLGCLVASAVEMFALVLLCEGLGALLVVMILSIVPRRSA